MSEGAIELQRDVEATQVPSGDLVTLPKGTTVGITQSLGGTYTVHVAQATASGAFARKMATHWEWTQRDSAPRGDGLYLEEEKGLGATEELL